MARPTLGYQTVVRDYPRSPKVNALSVGAEMLYLRLLVLADCEGRFIGSPKAVLGLALAERWENDTVTAADATAWLDEMEGLGMIARYEAEGQRRLVILNFYRMKNDRVEPKHPAPPFELSVDGNRINIPTGDIPRPQVGDASSPSRGHTRPSTGDSTETETETETDTETEPQEARAPRSRSTSRKVPKVLQSKTAMREAIALGRNKALTFGDCVQLMRWAKVRGEHGKPMNRRKCSVLIGRVRDPEASKPLWNLRGAVNDALEADKLWATLYEPKPDSPHATSQAVTAPGQLPPSKMPFNALSDAYEAARIAKRDEEVQRRMAEERSEPRLVEVEPDDPLALPTRGLGARVLDSGGSFDSQRVGGADGARRAAQ